MIVKIVNGRAILMIALGLRYLSMSILYVRRIQGGKKTQQDDSDYQHRNTNSGNRHSNHNHHAQALRVRIAILQQAFTDTDSYIYE